MPSLLLPVTKSNLYHRERVRIVLLFFFELVQVVIRATRRDRILTTYSRPRVVDTAAARLGVEELAGFTKQVIALAAQHPFLVVHLRVTRGRDFFRHAEVSREPANVPRRHLYAFIH